MNARRKQAAGASKTGTWAVGQHCAMPHEYASLIGKRGCRMGLPAYAGSCGDAYEQRWSEGERGCISCVV